MRVVYFIFSLALTVGLIIVLNVPLPAGKSKTPRMGYFLSPQKGFWQNAEAADKEFSAAIHSPELKGKVNVYFDERLVPHIYAENDHDANFVQGYLHARFRLWQMDFQTYAAGGRLSEIMGAEGSGTSFLKIDKFFRRLGMVYAAENSLKQMESDPQSKASADAYTAGVNAYINTLDEKDYPLEYKMLDYRPEHWTNLKTALLLKYMSYDLAAYEQDFEMTNARSIFSAKQFEKLYPYGQDSLDPIVPKGTVFAKAGLVVKKPLNADSLYFSFNSDTSKAQAFNPKPDPANGSNNWAVSGIKTASGKPILCNDPHLGLNLPSLWYEVQISTPGNNVYGVGLPGAPNVIIGFNDNVAFGFTNSGRDVRDYYEITFKDSTMQQYLYNGEWQNTTFRDEVIKIKDAVADTQHMAMTVWGPVMYDKNYPNILKDGKAYACRWKAHDPSDELKTFGKLDKAKNYDDYVDAISTFSCPAQNMIFADKAGDIALRQQGSFPAKWRRQGDFLMPGNDSSYRWQGIIGDSFNITLHNPTYGFVSSANQYPYDTTYPYYLGGSNPPYRGIIINRNLTQMEDITPADMQLLQTNNYNIFAEMARPVLLKYIDEPALNDTEKTLLETYKNWNLRNDIGEKGATVFTVWVDSIMAEMYTDELSQSALPMPEPVQSTMLESLLKDSTYEFADNINTPQKETIKDVVTAAFKKAAKELIIVDKTGKLAWGKYKDTGIRHLLKIPAFSRLHLPAGGGTHVINATKQFHGPSWRMVVHLNDKTEAYGVYPGGQSGNPGSKYYDTFVDNWVNGKYYTLSILSETEITNNKKLKGKMTFNNG